ncbi:hypothetical protein PENSPDRAFT_151230 [Peniophora sp. CONT]|nr:hypothetical protein PENSPDRAFT_151230 [Peniophora sp. CONT]
MHGPAWQTDYALKHLALPSRTHFNLYHHTIDADDDEFELLATVARVLCQGTPPKKLRLEWESLSLGARLDQEHEHDMGGASFGSFALGRLAHKLPTLGISTLLEGITILTILPQLGDTAASYWPAMFQCLPNVTMFVLGCSSAREHLWGGTHLSEETKPGLIRILDTLFARPRPVFPRLRHLRIAPDVRPTWLPLSSIHSYLRGRTPNDVHVLDILDLPSYREPTMPIQSQLDFDFSGLAKQIIWRQPGAVEDILSRNKLCTLMPAGTPL